MRSTDDGETVLRNVRFAAVLRARRLIAGLTQKQLADLAGVGVRTVRELERARVGRPQRGTIDLLASALGLTGAAREAFALLSTDVLAGDALVVLDGDVAERGGYL